MLGLPTGVIVVLGAVPVAWWVLFPSSTEKFRFTPIAAMQAAPLEAEKLAVMESVPDTSGNARFAA